MAHVGGSWHWALRVTPALGLIAVILIKFIQEPARGLSDQAQELEPTSYRDDLKSLIKKYVFSAFNTCNRFDIGKFIQLRRVIYYYIYSFL